MSRFEAGVGEDSAAFGERVARGYVGSMEDSVKGEIIVGHGIDLVAIARIAELMERHPDRFLTRCFTEAERAYSDSNTKRRLEHYAGRFAAKEAILKVLGTGWTQGIGWTDAEVVREDTGRPTVKLHQVCAKIAAEQGITHWHLSITHTETHAMASAIGCRTVQ